jgi:hypothetical protein
VNEGAPRADALASYARRRVMAQNKKYSIKHGISPSKGDARDAVSRLLCKD